jgi:hypothetical protein
MIPCETVRIHLAIFLLIHGVAHLPGFLLPWRLAMLPDLAYKGLLIWR